MAIWILLLLPGCRPGEGVFDFGPDPFDDDDDHDDRDDTDDPRDTDDPDDTGDACGETDCGFEGTRSLSDADAKVYSSMSNQDAGRLVEIADLDGDGANDLVVPTMYADGYSGGAYIVPGPIEGTTTLQEGYHISASRSISSAGRSMGVGDVDGDGVNDLAIGAPDGTAKEWILFGPITGDVALTDADVVFSGDTESEVGHGSDLADVNGDGVEDAVIGAYEDATGGYQAGTVFVEYGPLLAGSYDLHVDYDARLIGEYVSAYAGRYVRAGQDLDGDGVGDILAAAPYASASGPYSGTAYVVYGGVTGDLSLADADGMLFGEAPSDYAGEELTMGDVDGDGLADVVVAAYGTMERNAGAAYVVYGPASGTRGLAEADIVLRGDDTNQLFGLGLAVADVNGDGAGELLVGGIGDSTEARSAGAAWLFFGPLSGTLGPSDAAAVFTGETRGGEAGESVAFGDLDLDGDLDVIVGAPAESTGGPQAGAVYVLSAD